jgi:hypothetical protein
MSLSNQEIFAAASNAAIKAYREAEPVPMIVGEAASLFGNELKPGGKQYYVADGVCGFAWVKISPARGPFVSYLKKEGIGSKDSYEGGYRLSSYDCVPGDHGQSMQRKEAACSAFVAVLKDNGINAYMGSRMD